MSDPNPPPGFEPLFRTSPFLETVGPLFYRRDPERGLVIGLRIAEKHANARGIAHGGLLVTLADIALGYQTAFGQDPPAGLITANLTADFAGRGQDRRLGRGACGRAEARWPPRLRQCVPGGRWRAHRARRARCSRAPAPLGEAPQT